MEVEEGGSRDEDDLLEGSSSLSRRKRVREGSSSLPSPDFWHCKHGWKHSHGYLFFVRSLDAVALDGSSDLGGPCAGYCVHELAALCHMLFSQRGFMTPPSRYYPPSCLLLRSSASLGGRLTAAFLFLVFVAGCQQ